jgi:hypothetical protein
MNNLVEISMDKEVRDNPQRIAQMIIELADDIEICQNDLSKLKERKLFKRIVSNNTKDLADAMIKQNDTISLFLNIVQALIMFNMNNTVILAEIQRELSMHEKGRGDFQNKYVAMAQEYITESYQAALALKNQLEAQSQTIRDLEERVSQIDAAQKARQTTNIQIPQNDIACVTSERTAIWKLTTSWWLLLGFTLGVFNWVMFIYIGIKVKHKPWFAYGIFYALPFLGLFAFPDWDALYGVTVIIGMISLVHGFRVREEYLTRRILLDQIKPDTMSEQKLRQEYHLAEKEVVLTQSEHSSK